MKNYRAVIIIPLVNSLWYLWGFYLYAYSPLPSFGESTSSLYDIIWPIAFWSFIAFTLFLLGYFVYFFIISEEVRWRIRVYTALFGLSVPLLLGTINNYWWYEVPPMSEQKAIQFADEMIGERLKRDDYRREIYWDRVNHEWLVIYMKAGSTECDEVSIHRVYTMAGGGGCNEMIARAVANSREK